MPRFLYSVRFQVVLIVLVAIVPAFVALWYNSGRVEKRYTQDVFARQLYEAALLRDELVHALRSGRHLLRSLALLPQVRERDSDGCRAVFESIQDEFERYSRIVARRPDGILFASSLPTQGPVSYREKQWFREVLERRDFVVGNPEVGKITGVPVIPMAYPVLGRQARLESIVGAALDLGWVGRLLRSIGSKADQEVLLVDGSARVVFSNFSPERWAGTPLPKGPLKEAVKGGVKATFEANGLDGVRRLYALLPLGGDFGKGLFILAGRNSRKIHEAFKRRLFTGIFFLLVLAAVAVALGMAGSEALVLRPLRRLVAATQGMASGALDTRTHMDHGKGELGHLARSFDEMVASLERMISRDKEMEQLLRRQYSELSTLNSIIESTLKTHDLDERLETILESIMGLADAEMGMVHLVEGSGLVLRKWRGISDDLRAHVLYFHIDEIPSWMSEAGVVSERLGEGGLIPEVLKREGIQTYMAVPLRSQRDSAGGYLLGYLTIATRKFTQSAEEDYRRIEALSNRLVLSIIDALLHRAASERLARIQVLRDIDLAIMKQRSIDEIVEIVISNIPKDLGAEAVALSLFDGGPQKPKVFIMRLPNGTLIEERAFELAESLLEYLMERRETVIIHDMSKDPRLQMHRELIKKHRLVSYLGVPLVVQDEVLGILHILTTHPRVFRDEDVAFFVTLAGQTAVAISNIRLLEDLKASEQRYRELAEKAPDVVYRLRLRPGPSLDYVSPKCTELLGYSQEDLYSDPSILYRAVVREDRPLVDEMLKGRLGLVQPKSIRLVTKDGGLIHSEHHIQPIYEGGELVALQGIARDVTDRVMAERAFREGELKTRMVLETAMDAVIMIDAQGRVTVWNRTAERMFGYAADEVVGKDLCQLIVPKRFHWNYRKGLERFQEGGEGPVVGNVVEVVGRKKDGSEFPAEVSVNSVKMSDGWYAVGVVRDITERKRTEDLLREKVRTLSALYDEARRLAETADLGSIAKQIVRTCVDVMGASLAWIGRSLPDGTVEVISHHPEQERYPLEIEVRWVGGPQADGPTGRAIRTGAPQIFEDIMAEAGFEAWREKALKAGFTCSAAFPLISRGVTFGALNVYSDRPGFFTPERVELFQALAFHDAAALENARLFEELERHAAELEKRIKERTAQLEEEKGRAEAASRAKSDFVANISHEIRTPLNAILGFTQVLGRDPSLTASQRKNVETIERAGRHLLTLINDILDISKIEAGRMEISPLAFSLQLFLEDIELIFRPQAKAKGLGFVMERDVRLPSILADEGKLRQVFTNVVGNAVKFTQKGSVSVRVRVHVEGVKGQEATLVAEIEDTGPGIPLEEQRRVFEPFEQGALPTMPGGTGLGLAISRGLVRIMGGDITLHSEPGRGSLFRIEVPVRIVDTAPPADVEGKAVVGLAPGTGPVRALVVDDSPENRQLLRTLLQRVGIEVVEAADGEGAVEAFKAHGPDVVFMDLRMPVMDGYEATRRIRAADGERRTPIIAVSAGVLEEAEEKIREAGADAFILKPFDQKEIYDILAGLLGIEYVYEDTGEDAWKSEGGMPKIEGRAASLLSQEMVNALLDSIGTGDIGRIRELIAEVEGRHPALAKAMGDIADKYDYEGLKRMILGDE